MLRAMAIKRGVNQACAVCKYQRRRCHKDCLLLPYFPADQQGAFRIAHRLFGVSNMKRILNRVHPDLRGEAMRSIKYESFIRSKFPVHGCSVVLWQLRYQLQHAMNELRCVYSQLAAVKERCGGETAQKSDNFKANNALFFAGYSGNFGCDSSYLAAIKKRSHGGTSAKSDLTVDHFDVHPSSDDSALPPSFPNGGCNGKFGYVCSNLAAIKKPSGGETSRKPDFLVDNSAIRRRLDEADCEELKPFARAQTEQFLNSDNHHINGSTVKPKTRESREKLANQGACASISLS